MLTGGAAAGVAGAVWGSGLAALRNESAKFYAASMGANFFLLSSTYIALDEIIADKLGRRDITVSSAAGAVTGGVYAGIIGGRVRGLQGAVAGVAAGAAYVVGREQFDRWRLSKAVERYEEKYGTAPAVYYPETKLLVEGKGPVKQLDLPSLLPASAKVSDEEIERRIQARFEELCRDDANTGMTEK
ncbi:TPA: hypothetical protein N0F65_001313 [Lagenidium giganteum]|uniref:Uncharacterized protein n=1 Tax=Lagenidium giganteum TaxID=4803 RepID=A0AAV2Z264_9STRA|nr:TPA: hypothetical protein N0F65_001313 [Lagenidium giganteum]